MFRDFKYASNGYDKNNLPPTVEEFKKIRESFAPVTPNMIYEQTIRAKKPKHGLDLTNRPPVSKSIIGQAGRLKQLKYTKSCSNTAEPVGVNSYDEISFIESTPLSVAYFDHNNIEFIRHQIVKIIQKNHGIKIGLQPYKPLKMFMFLTFNDLSCDMCQDSTRNFDIMNSYTLQLLEKRLIQNINHQLGYLSWVENSIYNIRVPNPEYTRVQDTAVNLSRYYNGMPYQW